ncbi:MAG: phosphoribosylformylglycinamidine synthase I [Draconibacterium sp.]|nr:phosphoribosylformylglycinamidine synthase I [Draconibacterium sp.]
MIQFPGSNTERETILAVQRAEMAPVEFLWNENYDTLKTCDGYIIVGGFSYEDRARAGIISSLDPVISILREQSERGKPVLGICNGAQILVESGMVPGLKKYALGVALTDNKRTKDGYVLGTGYYNNWSNLVLSAPKERCAFSNQLQRGHIINIPFAHAEGRFVMENELLQELITNDQIVYRYGDSSGKIVNEFPINPNGSVCNIAAICNRKGNVMAIMPHPERTTNGDAIFNSMREYIINGSFGNFYNLNYKPPIYSIERLTNNEKNSVEWYIDSIITDNEAVSVQTALDKLNIPVTIKKYGYWNINFDTEDWIASEKQIDSSGELYNSNKETLINFNKDAKSRYFLVQPHEDLLGRQKTEILKSHFNVHNLSDIKNGVVWSIAPKNATAKSAVEKALETNIFFNPFSHNCYEI